MVVPVASVMDTISTLSDVTPKKVAMLPRNDCATPGLNASTVRPADDVMTVLKSTCGSAVWEGDALAPVETVADALGGCVRDPVAVNVDVADAENVADAVMEPEGDTEAVSVPVSDPLADTEPDRDAVTDGTAWLQPTYFRQ